MIRWQWVGPSQYPVAGDDEGAFDERRGLGMRCGNSRPHVVGLRVGRERHGDTRAAQAAGEARAQFDGCGCSRR